MAFRYPPDHLRGLSTICYPAVPVSYTHLDVYKRQGEHQAASVASPSGGNNEYFIGRQKGLFASVRAGSIILIFIVSVLVG